MVGQVVDEEKVQLASDRVIYIVPKTLKKQFKKFKIITLTYPTGHTLRLTANSMMQFETENCGKKRKRNYNHWWDEKLTNNG